MSGRYPVLHAASSPLSIGKVLATLHGLFRPARGCLKCCCDRRNSNFTIELAKEIVRSTRSGHGLRNVLFDCHFPVHAGRVTEPARALTMRKLRYAHSGFSPIPPMGD